MKLQYYLRDRLPFIFFFCIAQCFVFLMLFCFQAKLELVILILMIEVTAGISSLGYGFLAKRTFYNSLLDNLSTLDKKYYIVEMLPQPNTYEEKIVVDTLYLINKSMIDNIKKREAEIRDFKDFVELWIHEVKIPIASMMLKCHNNPNSFSNDFVKELGRLSDYADQILYYIRGEYAENDFDFSDVDLKKVIKNLSLKNKDALIDNGIDYKVDIPKIVVSSDAKWLEFIINQLINNSIKYRADRGARIIISAYEQENRVYLKVYDNGIGIPKKDLGRVFEKSFTGENGRRRTKSTGMGLFIVKNLCNKLGHSVEIRSGKNKFTEVEIVFSKNDLYKM